MTATVACMSHGDRTGEAHRNGGVAVVDSHQQTQSLRFKVLADTKEGERVVLKCRTGRSKNEVPLKPQSTPAADGHTWWLSEPEAFPLEQWIRYRYCIVGSRRLVDSQPYLRKVQRDVKGAAEMIINDTPFKYKEPSQRQRHNPDQGQRLGGDKQQHRKEVTDGGSRAPAPGATALGASQRSLPAAAAAPASARAGQQETERFEARFEAEFVRFARRLQADFARLRAEAIMRENMGELLTAYMRREEHRTQAAEADARMSSLEEIIQDLREEVRDLKGWREQSEPKLAQVQRTLQEQQAHSKQVDSVMESLQSELKDCCSSLQRMQEEAQETGHCLRIMGEQFDGKAATLAGLVGQVEEGLRETQQEFSQGLEEALKACQDHSLRTQAETHASLEEGQQTASAALATLSEDHTATSTQLPSLHADPQQKKQRIEEGTSAANHLTTEFNKLQDTAEGLRRLQRLTEKHRQEICSLRHALADVQEGLGNVKDQMGVLSTGPTGTGAVSTEAPRRP